MIRKIEYGNSFISRAEGFTVFVFTYQVDRVKHLDFSYRGAAGVRQVTVIIADGKGTQSWRHKQSDKQGIPKKVCNESNRINYVCIIVSFQLSGNQEKKKNEQQRTSRKKMKK